MSIVREEIFGRVVVAEPFTKTEELILARERDPVSPRRRRLDARHLQSASHRRRAESGNSVDQLLQRF